MEELLLLKPTMEFKEEIKAYRQEFLEHEESMDGTSDLRIYHNPLDWLEWLKLGETKETCPKGWVPYTQYICIRKSDYKLIGMIDIRHELNEYCFKYAGHIGYSIRRSERGRGYATIQLRLALEICKLRDMDKVLLTCDKHNRASARTIIGNGGILENEIIDSDEGTITQRYWIEL